MLAEMGRAVGQIVGRDGPAAAALRPVYAWSLRAAYGRRGLPWHVNGEPMRIDPAVRHMLPHENEPALFAYLRDHIRPGQVVLDLGAFLGTYAILAARRAGPTGRVVAFEPSPSTFEGLRRHLRMNGLEAPQVDARCAAVGARTGQQRLQVWGDEPYRNMIAPDGASGVPIDVVTLDDVCRAWDRPPDWIRMDVQGQEFDVLRGARDLLRAGRGHLRIVAEMHPEQWPGYGVPVADAAAAFADLGVRARALPGTGPDGAPFVQGGHALLEVL